MTSLETAKRPSTLRRTWTLAILSVALVPLAIVAVLVVGIQRAGLVAAENELELAVASQAARDIDSAVGAVEVAVHRAAKLLASERIGDEELRLDLAREALAGAALVDWVAVFGRDGVYIGSIEKSGRHAETQLRSERSSVRAVWAHDADGARSRYIEPIVADGVTTGWLLAGANLDHLDALASDVSLSRFGRPDCVVVVDRDRHVVAGAPSAWARGRDLARTGAWAHVALEPGVFQRPIDVHTSWVGPGGEAMVGTLRTLPSEEWAVLVERPEAEAFVALGASRRAFLAVGFALAVLALVLGTLLARRMTRPITELVSLTNAYARRDFGRRSEIHGPEELAGLGRALEAMADAISSTEAEVKRRAAVEASLARYLPSEVAEAIALEGEGGGEILAGHRAEVSIVFADIASFTPFVERAPPELVAELLNELFTLLTETVFRHGGMVDKFIGDCVMAVFGVRPHDGPLGDHVVAALSAAEDMRRFVEASAPRWRKRFDVEVKLGIGVGSGLALVGNLGSDRRREFTAVGDSVNVAARLEALALPGQILVADSVAAKAPPTFMLRSLGRHGVRGRSAPIEIFELVG